MSKKTTKVKGTYILNSSVLFIFLERLLHSEDRNQEPTTGEGGGESFYLTMGLRLHPPAIANTLLLLTLNILTLLPHGLVGKPADEENSRSSALLQRVKRGWVWNQFFVLEEYTGLDPLYIGKVGVDFEGA